MRSFTAMIAAAIVIAVICATGLASAQLSPLDPTQPPAVEPPIPPTQTPTATPTVTPMVTPPQLPPDAPTRPPQPTIAPPQSLTVQPPEGDSAGAGTQVSSGPADKMYPKISGDTIIWVYSDSSNDSFWVQLYNTTSEETSTISDAMSVPLAMPRQLAIAGGTAVWSGMNPETEAVDIYVYDIASAGLQQVTDGPGMHMDPGVSEDYVIWTNLTDESSDVYLYEIAGESTIPFVTDPFYQMETALGGNTTAWVDNETESGDFDIVVAFFGESAGSFLGGFGDDRYPDISSDGRYVAWISFLENQSAVYLYDVMEDNATRVTGESAFPDAVAVEWNIVVYSDLRSGNHDIYMYEIDTGNETLVTEDPYDQSYPDVSDGEIVWMGNNTGQWEIYRASAGEQDQSGIAGGPTPVPEQTPFSKSIGTPATPSG